MNGTFERFHAHAGQAQLGSAVVRALEASSAHGATVAPGGGMPFDPVLSALGLWTYGQYMKGTKQVRISRRHQHAVVTPRRNDGPRKAFTDLDNQAEALDDLSGLQSAGPCSAPWLSRNDAVTSPGTR
jgi:hypothetical protein